MKTILVIGASRGVGLETVRQGLEAGYRMRALARSADDIPLSSPALQKINASALDPSAVGAAVEGVDAVITALGVPPGFEDVRLFSDGMKIATSAMKQTGVRRLVAVTGIGVGSSKGIGGTLFTGFLQPLFLEKVHEDRNREEAIVMGSGLQWTIVRPGFLTRFPKTGRYRILTNPKDWKGGFITRGDVADFLLKAVEDDGFIGQTPLVIS